MEKIIAGKLFISQEYSQCTAGKQKMGTINLSDFSKWQPEVVILDFFVVKVAFWPSFLKKTQDWKGVN